MTSPDKVRIVFTAYCWTCTTTMRFDEQKALTSWVRSHTTVPDGQTYIPHDVETTREPWCA